MKARDNAMTRGRFANPRLPPNMAKLVEKRRKERVDRSRLIANNQEYQRQLMNATTTHRREEEMQRLAAHLNTPTPTTTSNPILIRSGHIPQSSPAHQQAADQQAGMNNARIQLNRLILAQEEYTRPMARLRRLSLLIR